MGAILLSPAGVEDGAGSRRPRQSCCAGQNVDWRHIVLRREPSPSFGISLRRLRKERNPVSTRASEKAGLHIDEKLVARILKVEVTHRQLPDAILGGKGRVLGFFHRETLRLVSKVRAGGIKNRIVIPAPQFKRYFACDRASYPPLRHLPEHHGLGIEPAAMIEEPPQAAP